MTGAQNLISGIVDTQNNCNNSCTTIIVQPLMNYNNADIPFPGKPSRVMHSKIYVVFIALEYDCVETKLNQTKITYAPNK